MVWDLGNVLIDWQPGRAVATGVGEDEAARFLAADDFDFMAWNHVQDAGGTWADALAAVAESHPHWRDHAAAYHRHFVDSLVGEVPGSADLVRDLRAAGVPQWGLTNWSAELYPHAPERYAVLAELEDVVVSGREGLAKPDPRIFDLTVARTGLPASALVFVDDRADNVEAAVAAGLQGVVFRDAVQVRSELRKRGLPV
ncbi:HAD family hydrolase [Nocardioides flavescens]|uniref:HAD family hydrolase n=1 Tax=Nocardioides flavescens TaxID=2691959 RepID=UPI00301DA8A6